MEKKYIPLTFFGIYFTNVHLPFQNVNQGLSHVEYHLAHTGCINHLVSYQLQSYPHGGNVLDFQMWKTCFKNLAQNLRRGDNPLFNIFHHVLLLRTDTERFVGHVSGSCCTAHFELRHRAHQTFLSLFYWNCLSIKISSLSSGLYHQSPSPTAGEWGQDKGWVIWALESGHLGQIGLCHSWTAEPRANYLTLCSWMPIKCGSIEQSRPQVILSLKSLHHK